MRSFERRRERAEATMEELVFIDGRSRVLRVDWW